MEINSKSSWPGSDLSNFSPHSFNFDGVECASMEGLVQAFKFDKFPIQIEVCKLVGIVAKQRGVERNDSWQKVQKLWWQDQEYDRKGPEYQDLLDRAYSALSENIKFQKALLATGDDNFTHTIGSREQSETVLTISEFCSRLHSIRAQLQDVLSP